MYKRILCLDFDGVVHSYVSGWQGADVVPDPIVPGAVAFILEALARGWDVQIYSSRSHQAGGIEAMRNWLREESGTAWHESAAGPGLEDVKFPTAKPAAVISIDDRALTFTGVWPAFSQLDAFKPWNK